MAFFSTSTAHRGENFVRVVQQIHTGLWVHTYIREQVDATTARRGGGNPGVSVRESGLRGQVKKRQRCG